MPPKLRPIKKSIALTSNPPQHTFENDPNHRSNFLERSLKKSDKEISALIKLNQSLKSMRDYIVAEYGMNVLLDIGEGYIALNKVKIDNDDNDDNGDGDGSGSGDNELVIKHSLGGLSRVGVDSSKKDGKDGSSPADTTANDNTDNANDNNADATSNANDKDENDDKIKVEVGEGNNDNDNETTSMSMDVDVDVSVNDDAGVDMNADESKSNSEIPNENNNNNDNENDNGGGDKQTKDGDENGNEDVSNKNTNTNEHENENETNSTSASNINPESDPQFKPLITNFLLRLKLRRKLLNRLSRRLLRLNHAMDGRLQKISPPALPKYGTSYSKHGTKGTKGTKGKDKDAKDKVSEFCREYDMRERVLRSVWGRKEEVMIQNMKEQEVKMDEEEKNNSADVNTNEKKQTAEEGDKVKQEEKVDVKEKDNVEEEKEEVGKVDEEEKVNLEKEDARETEKADEGNVRVEKSSDKVGEEGVQAETKTKGDDEETKTQAMEKIVSVNPEEGQEKEISMDVDVTVSADVNADGNANVNADTNANATSIENKDGEASDDKMEMETKPKVEEVTSQGENNVKDATDVKETTTPAPKSVDGDGDGDTAMEDVDASAVSTASAEQKDDIKEEKETENDKDEVKGPSEVKSDQNKTATATATDSKSNSDCDPDAKSSPPPPLPPTTTTFKIDPFLLDAEYQKDLKKLIQYDTDYAKKYSVHAPTSTIIKSTTALTQEELNALEKDEDDFDDTANVDGKKDNHIVGAMSKFMTKKEKVMEWKRWQTEFLSKIPDQPTFDELGMTNRVFLLEERRKACQKKESSAEEEDGDGNETENENEKKEGGEKEEGMMDVDKSDVDDDSDSDSKRKRDDGESDGDKPKKNRKEKDTDATTLQHKRISLDPVPSFYQQDYSRIHMIQSATLNAALHSNTREAYQQANAEYNKIFQQSQSLQGKKNHLENELVKLAYDFRMKVNGMTNNIAIAKAKWEADKKAFEAQKIQRIQMKMQMTGKTPSPAVIDAMRMSDDRMVKRSLMGAVDRVIIKDGSKDHATGSQYTSATLLHTKKNSIRDQVATTMAHCIDVVVNRVENGWFTDAVIDKAKGGEQFPPFVPPGSTKPDKVVMNAKGETFTQLQKRLKSDISKLKSQLDASESARSKAWSRLNKAKAAFNNRGGTAPASQTSTKSHRKKSSASTARYTGQASAATHAHPRPQRVNIPQQQHQVPIQQQSQHPHPRPVYRSPVTATNNPAVASAAAAAAEFKANMNVTGARTPGTGHPPPSGHPHPPPHPHPSGRTIKNPSGATNAPSSSSASENKYSLEKVRARIHSDGSVRPVSEPKRGKDGLFLRPAGRQRKGMDWDAHNGRWVPSNK